jgi:hypothetical protein
VSKRFRLKTAEAANGALMLPRALMKAESL